MIDTHTHLNFPILAQQLPAVLERAKAAGVYQYIVPGTNCEDSTSSVELSRNNEHIFAAVGIHPAEAGDYTDQGRNSIIKLLEDNKTIVSIGEVGLDYYREHNREPQIAVFREMIRLAGQYCLPLIIHSRDAAADTLKILQDTADGGQPAVIHCFTGSMEEAHNYLDAGCLISFTALITYKKNITLREVIRDLPIEKLMLETDSPYLPPEGRRGETGEPAYVREVASCIAELKNITLEEVDRITSATARNFFKL